MVRSKYPTMTSCGQLMMSYLILWFHPSLKPTAGRIRAEYHTRGLDKIPTNIHVEGLCNNN